MKKRLLTALIGAFTIASAFVFGGTVHAEEYNEIDMSAYNKQGITLDSTEKAYHVYGSSTSSNLVVKGGSAENPIRITLDNVKINLRDKDDNDHSREYSPIMIEANAYAVIDVVGDCDLIGGNDTGWGHNDGYAGLYCATDGHVTIQGTGSLEAEGGGNANWDEGAAGIGGNSCGASHGNESCGYVTIQGDVTVIAHGSKHAAGIGGGSDGNLQNVTVNGNCVIEAEGGQGGAGIGAGDNLANSEEVYLRSITINNCKEIIAIGGDTNGAGIGGGQGTCITGSISINGQGHITAIGGGNAAGIGGGDDNKIQGGSIDINISGAVIEATGGKNGAGIGTGDADQGMPINITGNGTITATGKEGGAGIGDGDGIDTASDINISNNKGVLSITAIGGDDSAGIGAGDGVKTHTINIKGEEGTRNLKIDAKTEDSASAGIGGSQGTTGDIYISNAEVKAEGGSLASAIGAGYSNGISHGEINRISINNCKITVPRNRCYPGIGAGYGTRINYIEISNSDYEGPQIGSSDYLSNYFGGGPNDIKEIKLINCGTIIAKAVGGKDEITPYVGIGPGVYGDIDLLEIRGCDHVEAYGATGGSGIGSSGKQDEMTKAWVSGYGGDVKELKITECNYVKGVGSAGGEKIEVVPSSESGEAGERECFNSYAGAGIGAGSKAKVEKITIQNCKTIEAIGGDDDEEKGGAGIGSGCMAGAGSIEITGCDTVNAEGGVCGAGIGSGGITYKMLDTREPAEALNKEIKALGMKFGDITITDCNSVTAKGGWSGTGIGGGESSAMNGTIRITNSNVTAIGGSYAAGIGTSRGSDCNGGIFISGERDKVVNATGGQYGAGIGAGYYDGDVENINIEGMTVNAQGGKCAPGIGTGGKDKHGASKFKSMKISGGIITAKAGEGCDDDIGTGTNNSKYPDGEYTVVGGTIFADEWTTGPIVDGGSIRMTAGKTVNAAGRTVYKTKCKLYEANVFAECDLDMYGCKDLMSDENQLLYLYLEKPDTSDTRTNITYTTGTYSGQTCEYCGGTCGNNEHWIKMANPLSFIAPEQEPIVGESLVLVVDSGKLSEGTVLSYAMAEGSAASILDGTNNVAPNTSVTIQADNLGKYTITATGETASDSELYWNSEASYTGEITKQKGTIEITSNISKVYDKEAVADPSTKTESDGAVTFEYYDQAGNKLESAPVDAGTYTVTAVLAESEHYSASSDSLTFTISPRPIALEIVGTEAEAMATVSVFTHNMVDHSGSIHLIVKEADTENLLYDQTLTVDAASAGVSFDSVVSKKYEVTASFINAEGTANYSCSETTSVLNKDLAARTIDVQTEYETVYGAEGFTLRPQVSAGSGTWTYEVVADTYSSAVPTLENSVQVNENGTVTVCHAGESVIKITITDPEGVYDTAYAYVDVKVAKAPLTVTASASVTEAVYGQLGNVEYSLAYEGFVSQDDESLIKNRYEAKGPSERSGVGEYPIKITNIAGKDAQFVSRDYKITPVEGSIKVTPATLKVTMNDVTGEYAGEEPEYTYETEGLVSWDSLADALGGEPVGTLDVEKTGAEYKELLKGTYPDAIMMEVAAQTEPKLFEDAGDSVKPEKDTLDSSNYSVTVSRGTLTIIPNSTPITITAASDSKTYDGKPLTNSSFTYTEGVLAEGDTLTAVVEGTITDPGQAANKVVSYKVMRGDTDVTDCYTFAASVDGTLVVKEKPASNGDKDDKSGNDSKKPKGVKTGDASGIAIWMMLFAAAAGLIGVWLRRSRVR